MITRTKTPLVTSDWLDPLILNLDVYHLATLNMPLVERRNLDELLAQIGSTSNWQITRVSLDSLDANLEILGQIEYSDERNHLWAIEGIGTIWNMLAAKDRYQLEKRLLNLSVTLADKSNRSILFIDFDLPKSLSELRVIAPQHQIPLPDKAAIDSLLAEFDLKSDRLTSVAGGLQHEEVRIGIKLALQSGATQTDQIEARLLAYKVAKLKDLGLEFLGENDTMSFGGLDRIAKAIGEVIEDFKPEARKKKIPLPKGWAFVGIPGAGKTHTAKCVAAALGYPLISVGIDAVKAGGADLLKRLLERIEASAPCVVYFDELDKFFSKGGDQQVVGVLATWLQEKTSHTFVIATLNRLANVPVEILRMGRFDRLFWVGFPHEQERYEILKLYLEKYDPVYGRSVLGRLEKEEWINLLNLTLNFTGSELKFLVERATKLEYYSINASQNIIKDWIASLANTIYTTSELVEMVTQSEEFTTHQHRYARNYILEWCDCRPNWVGVLSDITNSPKYLDLKNSSIEVSYQGLIVARKDMQSGYERNPDAIIEIKNQAAEKCEPASSPNSGKALFATEDINVFGDEDEDGNY
jgi:ATP-dependent 26S proteasome regulatory subunit